MVMDPWISHPETETVGQEVAISSPCTPDLEASDSLHNPLTASSPSAPDQSAINHQQLFFEDNFQPSKSSDQQSSFAKLPDSQEYLASLEKKLSSLQKGGKKGPTANSILQSLSQTKESCMLKLLTNSVENEKSLEEYLSDELKVNLLLKKIAPEKQAISAEELVHLLKADQLDLILSEINEEEASREEVLAATEQPESPSIPKSDSEEGGQ